MCIFRLKFIEKIEFEVNEKFAAVPVMLHIILKI